MVFGNMIKEHSPDPKDLAPRRNPNIMFYDGKTLVPMLAEQLVGKEAYELSFNLYTQQQPNDPMICDLSVSDTSKVQGILVPAPNNIKGLPPEMPQRLFNSEEWRTKDDESVYRSLAVPLDRDILAMVYADVHRVIPPPPRR